MKAVRKYVTYKAGGNKHEWIHIREMIISYSRSESQFKYFIQCFKERIRMRFVYPVILKLSAAMGSLVKISRLVASEFYFMRTSCSC